MQEAAAPLFKRMSGHIITAKDALRAKCWSPKAPEPNPLQQLQLELASELAKNFSDPEVNGKLSQLQTDVQAPNADLGVIIEQLNEIKAKVELAKLHPLIEAAEKLVTADRAAQGAVQLVDGQQETFDVLKDQAGNMKKGDNETFVDFLARVKDLLDKITSLKNSLPAAPEESDE